jgi:hypothetical protein
LTEYITVSKRDLDADTQLTLFAIGQEIDARIVSNQQCADDDEKLDQNALAYILPFMTAHGLYVQGLDVVVQATSDIDRVNENFSRLSPNAKPIPMALLRTLTETEALFTPKTEAAMHSLSAAANQTETPPTKALTALGIGALRGSMRAMAGHMLTKIYETASDATMAAIKDEIKEGLKSPGFQHQIGLFFLSNGGRLLELASQMPHYFSWVRPFLTLLK